MLIDIENKQNTSINHNHDINRYHEYFRTYFEKNEKLKEIFDNNHIYKIKKFLRDIDAEKTL
jgi:hypothetical protein